MSDKEPLLFRNVLGTLRPICGASDDALKAIGDATVRVEIKRTTGNIKRLAWYWVMLKIFLDNIEGDAFDGPVNTDMIHKWLKREAGLAKPVRSNKTGEILDYDYDSISFAKMTENERAEFVDFACKVLSRRLGVDVDTLRAEAQNT